MPIRRLVVPALIVVSLLVLAGPALGSSSGVVISSLRLRTAASPYDEYVEIRNTSSATVDLSGWKLLDCYTSGGTSRVGTETTVPAQTRLPAGRTFVFGKDRGDYTGVADLTYPFQVKEDGGFRLDDATGAVQDAAGAAAATGCHEGTGLALPATGSDVTFTRTRDTDDNATDFTGPAGAANGTACAADCAPPPVVTPIDALQGSGSATPFAGRTVTVTGVVVGVDSQQGVSNYVNLDPRQAGVYLETPTALQDSDPATSEGVFVGGLAAGARTRDRVGETMTVTGTATELFGLTTVDATGRAPSFTGTGDPANLPTPALLDPARAAAQTVSGGGTRSYYEALEAMRVSLDVGTADSGGTNKFGELFLRPGTARARVFRDPAQTAGPPELIAASQDAGSADVDPANPSANPPSSTRVEADLFDRVRGLVGPLGFSFSQYKIVPQPGAAPRVIPGPIPYPPPVPEPRPNTLRVANFNVENLFGVGAVDDGHTFTAEEVDAKTTRIADAVGRVLRRPDLVAVEEVAAREPLADVARKLGGYRAYWEPSNDARGIAVGFLVKSGLRVTDERQIGGDATTDVAGCADAGSSAARLFNRPPLVLDVRRGEDRFTAIGNHWASQSHPEACREAQAAYVRDYVAGLEARGRDAMVLGDLNDFEDSPALTTSLVGQGTSLANLWYEAPPGERYSYQFSGQLQTLDHIFVTRGLHRHVRDMRYVHFDNDYFDRGPRRAAGVSDHDAPLVTLGLGRRGRGRSVRGG